MNTAMIIICILGIIVNSLALFQNIKDENNNAILGWICAIIWTIIALINIFNS